MKKMMENKDNSIFGKDIHYLFSDYSKIDEEFVKQFDCGNEYINNYFERDALDDTKGVTRLIWKINSDKIKTDIIAMYTLSASAMFYELDKRRYLIPAIEIKMFAVSNKYQKLPYSKDNEDGVFSDWLMCYVIRRIRDITENYCGADKIILFSVPNAVSFYERNLFEKIEYKGIDLLKILDGCTAMIFDLNEK